jgi:hypothetical protein
MPTFEAIVNGTTYNLSDSNPFKVLSATGIGNAPVRRLEERGPLQDGATDIGYRLDPRIINLTISVRSSTTALADTNRDTLSAIFSPVGGRLVQLKVTRDDGAVRQIDCYAVGVLDMPAEPGQRVLAFQRVGVQLKAPSPVWYNPTERNITFTTGPGGPVATWYTGGGLVPGTSVLTYGTAITTGQVGTIGTPSQWTIYARAALTASGTMALWSIPGTAQFVNKGPSTAGTTGLLNIYNQNVNTTWGTASGTVHYWFTHDGSRLLCDIGVLSGVGTAATGGFSGNLGPNPLAGNTIRWRDKGAGTQTWSGSVSHAAVWNTKLTDAQRLGVEAAIFSSGSAFNGTATVSGTWDEYPVITLVGPMNDPVVMNHATGEMLDFTGATIGASDFVSINTQYGYKTVSTNSGSSIINQMSDDSDLATFHLAPGPNYIEVQYSGGTASASTVAVSYYDRYLGL